MRRLALLLLLGLPGCFSYYPYSYGYFANPWLAYASQQSQEVNQFSDDWIITHPIGR